MKNIIEIAFKKLLGNGRAWMCIDKFTAEFIGVIMEPISTLTDKILNLKYTHFPTKYINENNIINGEELFGITDIEDKTLEERAANIENQWSVLLRKSNYKAIETILQGMGFNIQVIENIPQDYNTYGARIVGNGFLITDDGESDPVSIRNGKHTFIVQSGDFHNETSFLKLINAVVNNKPGHNVAYVIPRYLRKKEIHHKMTKRQMQTYLKKCYCDCRAAGEH